MAYQSAKPEDRRPAEASTAGVKVPALLLNSGGPGWPLAGVQRIKSCASRSWSAKPLGVGTSMRLVVPGQVNPMIDRFLAISMLATCMAAKVELGSGGFFVDVVQATEDGPGEHLSVDRAKARHWGLQSERSIGSALVVVGNELGEQRSGMSLAQRQDIVGTRGVGSAQPAPDGVAPGAPGWCADALDAGPGDPGDDRGRRAGRDCPANRVLKIEMVALALGDGLGAGAFDSIG